MTTQGCKLDLRAWHLIHEHVFSSLIRDQSPARAHGHVDLLGDLHGREQRFVIGLV